MFNFGELQDKVAKLAQRSDDPDYKAKIGDWINLGQEYVINSYDFWAALQSSKRFSSVADHEKYYLPSDFDKPYRLFDRTNHRKLVWTTREEYYSANIATVANAVTGEPNWAMLYGVGAVCADPTDGFTVSVKSSSLSDNGGIVCRIEGWINSAKTVLGHENITISTSDPTSSVSGSVTFYDITKFTKSADTVGYVSLIDNTIADAGFLGDGFLVDGFLQDSGGTSLLANIGPYERESRYPVLYLGLIPNDAFNYEILYKRKVHRMVDDNDYPFMDCCDFLILYALGFAYNQEKESETRAATMWQKADANLTLLMRNEMDKLGPDHQHKWSPITLQGHRA